MENVDAMWEVGLFLNDLSMHDSSRDMVLAGEQQSAELKMALEQESEKGKRLEESLRRLDEEVRRTDELLYRMIPKAVAKRLRSGAQAVDTCETFPNITLLLSDVVGFTNICSGLPPLGVVDLLNRLYSCFDGLTEKHKVYKVETIGDAYMIASGCPVRTKFHAPFIAEMALDMVSSVQEVKDNSKDPPESLRIRVGLHTGSAVAGVVGVKMPRYCLFGNTVSTAEVMEATSSPQRIQVSQSTYDKLSEYGVYDLTEKGMVQCKDGATIQTYWLNGRPEVADCPKTAKLFAQLNKERELLADSNSTSNQSQTGEGWESVNASRGSSARTLASKRNSLNASARNSMGRMSIVLDGKFLNKRKSLAKLAEKTRGAV
ncbi:putative Soluble guanylyl cyclase beta subunit [Fasciola gigantica]|uniref:guanylate cyclase n=1 Tax=Fasciola gigantica TaxID=46835 RepID=A0A504YPV2_FASGI|nr:putative Soluble guanylyl cyclase beta subunit [Fasciola gigantica]